MTPPTTPYHQLQAITHHLLTTTNTHITTSQLIPQLHQLFATITGLNATATTSLYQKDTPLPTGIAISPHFAAICLIDDRYRTVQYLQSIKAAIEAALTRFDERPLHILYPGCGPYATLLLPLTTQFSAEQIQITLIDIHQDSLEMVQSLTRTLGVEAHIAATHQMDVLKYQQPADTLFHIIVVEIMQAALYNEGQLPITLHLLPQLHKNGFFIPQNITIDAFITNDLAGDYLHKPTPSPDITSQYMGTLIELNASTAASLAQQITRNPSQLKAVTFPLPLQLPTPAYLMLATTIQLFQSYMLYNKEADITRPIPLADFQNLAPNTAVSLTYQLGPQPKFIYQTLPTT